MAGINLTVRTRHQEVVDYINSHFHITRRSLTYGDGSVGSNQLRQALAEFMNKTAFKPRIPLKGNDVTILAGVSSVIDSLAFCLCEHGEGILLGRPTYVGFISDMVNRAGVKPVMVGFEKTGVHPMSLEAVKCYEDALIEANNNGVPVRALLLCHPHNPFGTFYNPEVVGAYLSLCSKYNIHFIRYASVIEYWKILTSGSVTRSMRTRSFRIGISLNLQFLFQYSLSTSKNSLIHPWYIVSMA